MNWKTKMSECCTTDAAGGVYDLAVIGAGSAGFSAAITAANEGAQVALIGHGTIGGTCVNVGCVPSKAMIRMAEALHGAQHAASRFAGISGQAQVENWQQIIAAKDELVTTLRQKKYIDLLPEYNGVAYMEGKASLTADGVLVGNKLLTPKMTIIATGSHSTLPPIPGIEDVEHLDSTAVLALETLPESLMVIGGGVIGCELGQMFARAGVKVTICCRSRLLPEAEPEVSEALQSYLDDEGITVCSGIGYQKIEQDGNLIRLYCESKNGPHTIEAEKLLVAAGRRANTDGLNLDDVGIELLRNGGIRVDDRLRTTKSGVYAVGDVTGRDQFVYMAAYGAKLAALNAMNGDSMVYDNSAMPWVVFTDPQVAGVGLTEAAARSAGYETKTSVLPLDQLPRALAARDTRGLIKLVADDKTDRLLGAQIIAPEGADSIQTAVLAIKHGMTAKDLGETIFPYLTTAEGLKLAALGFGTDVTKLSCCAG